MQAGFIKGNIKGLGAAAINLGMTTFCRKEIREIAQNLANTMKTVLPDITTEQVLQTMRKASTQVIKDAYVKGGAPLSGALLAQTPGEVPKNTLNLLKSGFKKLMTKLNS